MSLSGFLNNYPDIEMSIENIAQAYTSWVQEDRYMILERSKALWEAPKSSTMFEKETIAVKCAKRGNDVYSYRVLSRFGIFQDALIDLNVVYFDGSHMRTRVLFTTLTYDTKLKSRHQAWKAISKEYNLFMSKMRRVLGSISTARTFESFENGYPHVHVVLLFNDFTFQVREYTNRKGRKLLLVDDDIKDCISAMWHSNVDVKGVGNVSESINYLKKYISKCANFDSNDSKGIKTLAQCWAYKKRAYCLSGVFRTRMSDLIRNMHNSIRNMHNSIRNMHNSNSQLTQISLGGEEFKENKWSCLGFVSITVLGVEAFVWRLALAGALRERVYEDLGEREIKND